MKTNHMKLAIAAAAASASLAVAEPEPDTLLVSWGSSFESGDQMIAAIVNGTVLASSCANTLKMGDIKIKVDSDKELQGLVSIGAPSVADREEEPQEFDLENDDFCDAFWTADAAQVECRIPWKDEFDDAAASALTKRSSLDAMDGCFSNTPEAKWPMPIGDDVLDAFDEDGDETEWRELAAAEDSADGSLSERQSTCWNRQETREHNPRSPRKWRRYAQLSGNMDCGVLDCSASHSKTYSLTLGVSASANLGEFITAGFSVSDSRGYSDTYGCNGKPHDWLCVKHMSRFQGYTAMNGEYGNCLGWRPSGTVKVRSPLSKDVEAHFYCAKGKHACKEKDNVFWEDRGNGIHDGA